jgi:hypothetical protein
MASPFEHWGTTHRFASFDITERFENALFTKLVKSSDVSNWIAALMIIPKNKFNKDMLVAVAVKLNALGDPNEEVANAKVLLLIAGLLRNIEQAELDEVENMLRVKLAIAAYFEAYMKQVPPRRP